MPKRRLRRPRRPQTVSKIKLGKVRTASRTRSGAFREHVADPSSKKAFSEVSATEFRLVFSMIAKSVNLDFYRPCRGFRRFFKKACRSIDVSGMREKTSKNLRRKPPQPFPEGPEPSGTL